jgi:hypothetical protein
MKALDLYKFIQENDVEWRWENNDGEKDVLIFPYVFELKGFCELIKNYEPDEPLQVRLKNGYAAIWMKDLCEYFGIKLSEVFEEDKQ